MTGEELVEKVRASLPDAIIRAEVTLGDAVVHVQPENLLKVAGFLKESPELDFHYLSHITGVDYLEEEREPRFEAVYELHNLDRGDSIRLRVGLDEDDPKVPTVSEVWKGALFPERELFDMFGFQVEGHPNLKRLIMPEDWEGHPLRKDYPLVVEEVAFSHNPEHKQELIKDKKDMSPTPWE
ncbi:NADH-quinone oxidoreductase subunit C [Nitrospina sp. 32_T5]|uniref:NADH-quinone oxidoreductase subunit C n=1 Tax=unclassified Nitrospina TaxID=2638683 RepID=UPI003F9688FC